MIQDNYRDNEPLDTLFKETDTKEDLDAVFCSNLELFLSSISIAMLNTWSWKKELKKIQDTYHTVHKNITKLIVLYNNELKKRNIEYYDEKILRRINDIVSKLKNYELILFR